MEGALRPEVPQGRAAAGRAPCAGFADIVQTIRDIAGNRTIVSMTLLAGGASLFIGNAYQAQMPEFASDLGHVHADLSYSALLAADAAGALLAGLLLESRGLLQAKAAHRVHAGHALVLRDRRLCRSPGASRSRWCCCSSPASWSSRSPRWRRRWCSCTRRAAIRGRVIGLFNMSALGLRAFAGVTVGLLGGVIGIHWSLALSALALLVLAGSMLAWHASRQLRAQPARGIEGAARRSW